MKLLTLRLRNFKGVRDLRVEAGGNNIEIYGDNATGKTTIFDAFLWLLFDKDSQNKKDFEVKTLDRTGKVRHNLNHEVKGVFDVDGHIQTLKKVYSEKWTKKRGSTNAEFTGHTTDYYINSVPTQKKEYDDFVSGICDEDTFKLLTSPTYFNEHLHWQERRRVLLEVCGDVRDEDVIASNSKLSHLQEILSGRTLEDHKKVIAAKKKQINDELERIPVRIDEATRSLPDTSNLDKKKLETELAELRAKKEAKEQELIRIETGGEVAEKTKALREIESELIELKNEHNAEVALTITKLRGKQAEIGSQINELNMRLLTKQRETLQSKTEIERLNKEMEFLRGAFTRRNAIQFEFNQKKDCPTCGQKIPKSELEETRKKAEAAFNIEKAEALERINEQGKGAKEEAGKSQSRLYELDPQISELSLKIDKKKREADQIQADIDKVNTSRTQLDDNPDYQAKLKEKKAIETAIVRLKDSSENAVNGLQTELVDIRNDIGAIDAELYKFTQGAQNRARIDELTKQEKEHAKQYEELEGQLYLCEQFIVSKVSLLEEKINSRFKLARFKLFETQINQGINEVCETTYQGVPYSSMNHGACINVGLDIINTLSEHYKFRAPIFIDNREAITKLTETESQVISLVVSEMDKDLRVVPERKLKEVING